MKKDQNKRNQLIKNTMLLFLIMNIVSLSLLSINDNKLLKKSDYQQNNILNVGLNGSELKLIDSNDNTILNAKYKSEINEYNKVVNEDLNKAKSMLKKLNPKTIYKGAFSNVETKLEYKEEKQQSNISENQRQLDLESKRLNKKIEDLNSLEKEVLKIELAEEEKKKDTIKKKLKRYSNAGYNQINELYNINKKTSEYPVFKTIEDLLKNGIKRIRIESINYGRPILEKWGIIEPRYKFVLLKKEK